MNGLESYHSALSQLAGVQDEALANLKRAGDEFDNWIARQSEEFLALVKNKKSATKSLSSGASSDSTKENVKTDENAKATRPRRAAAKEATLLAKQQVNSKLNVKIRRPESPLNEIYIQVKQEKTDDMNAENALMPPPLGRPKRNAKKKLAEISENAILEPEYLSKQIKKEKISEVTRVTRGRASKNNKTSTGAGVRSSKKDSEEIIITEQPPIMIEITDSEEDSASAALPKHQESHQKTDGNEVEVKTESESNTPTAAPPKKARTKRKAGATKQNDLQPPPPPQREETPNDAQQNQAKKRNVSTSDEELQPTKSRRTKPKPKTKRTAPETDDTEYEDAVSISDAGKTFNKSPEPQNGANPNATVILSTPTSDLNDLKAFPIGVSDLMSATVVMTNGGAECNDRTMIVSSPNKKFAAVCPYSDANGDSLLTEDEDPLPEDLPPPPPPQKALPKDSAKGPKKPGFNAYTQSPVKQRVEAFEKMAAAAVLAEDQPPVRMTRTKKRNEEKKQQQQLEKQEVEDAQKEKKKEKPLAQPLPPKFFTPPFTGRFLPSASSSTTAAAAASGLKMTTAEQRERALRRREKEAEAQQKKEALLIQKAEQERRRREEKQRKAQLTREAQEKELAEKRQRAKEDGLKKKLMAQQKALEEKALQAERERLAKSNKDTKEKDKGQADLNKTPPLMNRPRPEWASSINLTHTAAGQSYIPSKIINSIFSCRALTMNLQEVFPDISARALQRKSSANWQTPPRYSKFRED